MMFPDGDGIDFSVDYDEETETYRSTWSDDRLPSVAVVALLEDATGADATEIEPLWNYVHPDALDDVFASTRARKRPGGRVTFRYAGFEATVCGDGEVSLSPVDRSE